MKIYSQNFVILKIEFIPFPKISFWGQLRFVEGKDQEQKAKKANLDKILFPKLALGMCQSIPLMSVDFLGL